MNIRRIVKLFEDTGSAKELTRVREALPKNINFQNAVVDEVTENPHTSTRAVAVALNVSQSTIIRTLKSWKFHPYKMILQQELHGEDFQKRTEFCNFIQRQIQ
jgi:DNA-binding MurR/RpiR family transcriptional regulator